MTIATVLADLATALADAQALAPVPSNVVADLQTAISHAQSLQTSSPLSSITNVSTTNYPPLPAPGQRWELHLHGSGGGFIPTTGTVISVGGQEYTATGDATLGPSTLRTWFLMSAGGYGSTLNPPNPPASIRIHPIDQTITPTKPYGIESHWQGYVYNGVFSPFTERFLDALIAQTLATQPVVAQRSALMGNSMGAWGGLSYGLRRASIFAAILVTQPRWKSPTVADWVKVSERTPVGLKMDDGTDFATHYDSIAYISDPSNALPFLAWTIGTSDAFTPFSDHQAAVAAFRARIRSPSATNSQRTGFAFGWVPGTHGSAGLGTVVANALIWTEPYRTTSYDPTNWRTDLGYPVFDNSSRDDDVTTAASGFINNGFKWRNVIESSTGWSCDVANVLGDTTVDVWPHSSVFTTQVSAPKTVAIPSGQWVTVAW